MDRYELRNTQFINYDISKEAAFAYCSLITFCVIPFIIYSNLKIYSIKQINNDSLLKFIAWLSFFFFIFYSVMSTDIILKILTGNIGEMRSNHYAGLGEEKWFNNYPFLIKYPVLFLNLLTGSPWIFQFLAFFSISIQKLGSKYGLLFLCSSLIGIVRNITDAGRSDVVYWLIGLGACYVFFKPWLNNSQWKSIRRIILLLILLEVFYFFTATSSRFDDVNYGNVSGTEGGFIVYAGQSYIYFCYFYDNFNCPIPTLEVIFPYIYHILGIAVGGIVPLQELLSLKTGFRLGVFYTFIGQILVTSSFQVALFYCVVITFLSLVVCRKVKNIKINVFISFLYLLFASVLFLGLFSHYYGFMSKTISVICFSFIILLLSKLKKSSF